MRGWGRIAAVVGLVWLLAGLAGSPADAQPQPAKIALLIGNQGYDRSVGELRNPHNDIAVVGEALRKQGFTLLPPVKDARRSAILGAVRDLVRQLNAAGAGAIGFLYYSGHGAAESDTGFNYLIPIDAKEPGSSTFWDDSLKLDDILKLLDGARGAAKFVVFDACRNELRVPAKSTNKGLTPVAEQQGMFIAYASAPGRTASDAGTTSGPFAAALAAELQKPGQDHLNLFQNVKEAVIATTGGSQQPWFMDGLVRRIYPTGVPQAVTPAPSAPSGRSEAAEAWDGIRQTQSIAVLEAFAKQFPGTVYAAQALERIKELNATQAVVGQPSLKQSPPAEQAPAKQAAVVQPPAPQPGRYAIGRETIKVGILHSLSGTMAISETTLKDVMLMLIEEQNKKGGLLGKKLEAVVVDPASNWPLFAEKARELISQKKVSAVFGCWTSVSRKSVLPVLKKFNSILFYPAQYEGEESERNVFYTGAAPNQQAIPAVDYLMSKDGGEVKRWVLAGTDYVYPRTTNKILEAYLLAKGVAKDDIMINYTPFGHSNWQTIVADIKKFGSAGKKTAVVSTINDDAKVPFYKELANAGVKATDIPVVALSVGEEELAGVDTKNLVGHLAAWNYFQSIKSSENDAFIARWKEFTKNPKRVTNDPMEAHVIGFAMWVKAVETAGTVDPDKVIDTLPGIEVPNLTGGVSKMLPNHHITKPVFNGEIRADGQFDVVWKTKDLVPGAAWSAYLEGSKDREADWVGKKCGNWNTRTKRCES